MSLTGLLGKAAVLRHQRPTRKCKRCGLQHDKANGDKCPHCGNLADSELSQLQEKLHRESEGEKSLGFYFIVAALILGAIMVLAFVG